MRLIILCYTINGRHPSHTEKFEKEKSMSNFASIVSTVAYVIGFLFMGVTATIHFLFVVAKKIDKRNKEDGCFFRYICLLTLTVSLLFLGLGYALAPDLPPLGLLTP